MPGTYSTEAFEKEYTYTGKDLGAVWTKDKTTFRVWAPTAEKVFVHLYASGMAGAKDLIGRLPMQKERQGTWTAEKEGDVNGIYYTYQVTVGGKTAEACDPYARAAGAGGTRAMVLDLSSVNPAGWEEDCDPNAGKSVTDAVIYELHLRDLSMDKSAGIRYAGKFLGLTEKGTKTLSGIPTGLDHIKELGITHLHLLPVCDYGSVDETRPDIPQFNWGYDPVNVNVPEGSYATDPYHGEVRVKEMKQMVRELHKNGISVIMDVVYNHVYDAEKFCFNLLVPGYFCRTDEDGRYSNGSLCGNDTATERSMVRKYIVDSVVYWADEYHIDGFRFDLVGLIDTETINTVIAEVHKKHPNVIFYGEGWTMDTVLTKEGYLLTTQLNASETPEFAFFSDTFRDALKGSVFKASEPGFVSGAPGLEETIQQCFMGMPFWCKSPTQTVNYTSCHDNYTLMDRISLSMPDTSFERKIQMNKLAAAIYLLAEGIPFFQAGEEMLRVRRDRSGTVVENAYDSPDEINCLKWDMLDKKEYYEVYQYYKGLIAFRKAHGVLRLREADEVKSHVLPVGGTEKNVAAFRILGGINGETAEEMFVVFNARRKKTKVSLPEGTWKVYINGEKSGTKALAAGVSGCVEIASISAEVLIKECE